MDDKWIFLNIKKQKYEDLDFDEKKKIAREVILIERFANIWGCENIISLGGRNFLELKHEVLKKVAEDNTAKAEAITKHTTSGLAAIKKHLGFTEENKNKKK